MTLQMSAKESESHLVPVPQPPTHFMMGNLPELRLEDTPVESLMKLAKEYGPIFQLNLGGGPIMVASTFELADELCDTKRFDKGMGPGLKQVRTVSGDGLFSAYTHEPNWRKVGVEVVLEPGFGHTFHLHPNQEEVLYVLEGTIEHYIETERTVLSVGGTAFMKRGTVHASFNYGDEAARVLAIVGPCKNVGDDGYEVIEVANEAPWSMLRQHVTRID